MLLFPLLVTLISLAFGWAVLAQYRVRRRPYQLVWSCALGLSAVASLAYVGAVATGGDAFLFRLYYIAGALLMAGWLGQGSVYLAAPRRTADILALVLGIASLFGTLALLAAPLDLGQLHALAGGPGTEVLLKGNPAGNLALVGIILVNTYGALAVVGVAAWSTWRLLGRHAPPRFAAGNTLIAVGTLINSIAGTLARLGHGAGFWLTLAVGWAVIYGGFLVTAAGGTAGASPQRGA